jgi:hypothetical protein
MQVQQRYWSVSDGWTGSGDWVRNARTSLVLVFGPRQLLLSPEPIERVKSAFPNAQIVGCSTAGEIVGTRVNDGTLAFTAIEFEKSSIRVVTTDLTPQTSSHDAGAKLATLLDDSGLVHALVLSDGLHVNGSELVRGMVDQLPSHVAVTGGLAGDGAAFEQTLVHLNGNAVADRAVAIGLYGSALHVGYGSRGGWEPFGPERIVTRSVGNVLYELDGESALNLYERYLGEHAADLPASALRFPLSVRPNLSSTGIVRTILGIDKDKQCMTFAGDIAQGMYARLMRADIDRLIDGASGAAKVARSAIGERPADLAILISCVGRKLVLKQRVEEEVEAVREVLGSSTILAGFYSYGEISPFGPREQSALHNQTMTVTTFSEAA